MKKTLSILVATLLFLASLPLAQAEFFEMERTEILRQQRALQRELTKARHGSSSRLSQLKLELIDLQQALQDLRKQRTAERRERVLMQRKRLRPISLRVVPETPKNIINVSESGKASYYAEMFNGRKTASGEIFSNSNMTAAHKTLPFGTRVKVRNPNNGNTIEVMINDRGPFSPGRIIDLTSTAFSQLDNLSRGVIEVEIEVLE